MPVPRVTATDVSAPCSDGLTALGNSTVYNSLLATDDPFSPEYRRLVHDVCKPLNGNLCLIVETNLLEDSSVNIPVCVPAACINTEDETALSTAASNNVEWQQYCGQGGNCPVSLSCGTDANLIGVAVVVALAFGLACFGCCVWQFKRRKPSVRMVEL